MDSIKNFSIKKKDYYDFSDFVNMIGCSILPNIESMKDSDKYYIYKLFPKLKFINKDTTYNEVVEILTDYKNKINLLQNYGFEMLTLIDKEEKSWYFSDRMQNINGVRKHIKEFTDGAKVNLRYRVFDSDKYYDESLSYIAINPGYKFGVCYTFDDDKISYEIINKEIMVSSLDFDINSFPSKEEIRS